MSNIKTSNENIILLGRSKPENLPPNSNHIYTDFNDSSFPNRLENQLENLVSGNLFVCFFAGADSYEDVSCFNPKTFLNAMQLNVVGHIQIVKALICISKKVNKIRIVAASSSVLNEQPQRKTLVYAASKIALEEAMRHAAIEFGNTDIRLRMLRIPFIGHKMKSVAEGKIQVEENSENAFNRVLLSAIFENIESFFKSENGMPLYEISDIR